MGFLDRWHNWLGMRHHSLEWYEKDMSEEFEELKQEERLLHKWSEVSDVAYTYTRAKWDGHKLELPVSRWSLVIGVPYMLAKYTGRFMFFRSAVRKAGGDKDIRCVRNPKKFEKLSRTVEKQGITVDLEELRKIVEKRLRYWPLLP